MLRKASEPFLKAMLASVGFLGIYITLIAMISEHLESALQFLNYSLSWALDCMMMGILTCKQP